jgi:hypothetical protein
VSESVSPMSLFNAFGFHIPCSMGRDTGSGLFSVLRWDDVNKAVVKKIYQSDRIENARGKESIILRYFSLRYSSPQCAMFNAFGFHVPCSMGSVFFGMKRYSRDTAETND